MTSAPRDSNAVLVLGDFAMSCEVYIPGRVEPTSKVDVVQSGELVLLWTIHMRHLQVNPLRCQGS